MILVMLLVPNRDSTYTSSKIDPNYIDPNIVPIVKQIVGMCLLKKKHLGCHLLI